MSDYNPGIYYNLDFDEYLAIDAVSNTAMSQAAKSAKHYRFADGLERAKYLVLGNMVHTARLEPDLFAQRYAVCPAYQNDAENCTGAGKPSTSKATSYVKAKVAEFESIETAKGREVVEQSWYDEMLLIVESLYADHHANALFNTRGPFEVTLVWNDPETGLLCKGRMDKLCPDQGKFGDLKTTVDLLKFPRAFTDYDYARQMSHYRAGYAAITGELLTPWICAIEKQSPYCVHTAPVDEESLDWGETEQQRLLRLIADCHETGSWPGPEQPEAWRVAEWKMNQGSVELTIGGQSVEV